MRGKPGSGRIRRPRFGLIPAHAGKTKTYTGSLRSCRAHPRACGENVASTSFISRAAGSSPRMRGKRQRLEQRTGAPGLIPAHAGKTRLFQGMNVPRPAHPRACGENEILTAEDLNAQGSSPRMRGKPPPFEIEDTAVRLIPAHAGKTLRRSRAA